MDKPSFGTKLWKFLKDAVALFLITLIAAVALGYVNELTAGTIAERKAEEKAKAYRNVFPEAVSIEDSESNESIKNTIANAAEVLKKAGYPEAQIADACLVYDDKEELIGYIASVTAKGYDVMTLTFGYTTDGTITGLEFLEINETPGLGMKADTEEYRSKFVGIRAERLVVTKTGAKEENEIDAISGATYTSNGVIEGINAGICFIEELQKTVGGAK